MSEPWHWTRECACGFARKARLSTRSKPLPDCAGSCYDMPPGIAHLEYAGEAPHVHWTCPDCRFETVAYQQPDWQAIPPEYLPGPAGPAPYPATAQTFEQMRERALRQYYEVQNTGSKPAGGE